MMMRFASIWDLKSENLSKKMMPSKLLFLLVLLIVDFGDLCAQNNLDQQHGNLITHDREIHRHYVDLAFESYKVASYQEATLLLSKAREFFPLSRGYYVLSSFLERKNSNFVRELFYLSKALSVPDDFVTVFQKRDLERRIYQLNYIMKQYSTIINLYEQEDKNFPDQEKDFYYVLSLYSGCYDPELESLKEDFLYIYPDDVRFYLPLLNCKNFYDVYFPRLQFLTASHFQSSSNGEDLPTRALSALERSIFLSHVRRIDDIERQKKILSSIFFWFKGDFNYINYVKSLEIELPAGQEVKKQWDHLYLDKDFLTDEEIARHTRTDAVYVGYDRDFDGIPDERGFFQGSSEGIWAYDSDQNGIPEYSVYFKDKKIQKIIEERGSKTLEWEFTRFPYMKSVNINEGINETGKAKKILYHILEGQIAVNSEESKVIWDNWEPVPVLKQGGLPEIWKVLEHTHQIDEHIPGKYFRKTLLRYGSAYQVFEDSMDKGYFDRCLVLDNWKIVYGLRKLTQKARFDIYEHYENGFFNGLVYFGDDGMQPSYYGNFYGNDVIKIWVFNKENYVSIMNTQHLDEMLVYTQTVDIKKLTPKSILQWKNIPEFISKLL